MRVPWASAGAIALEHEPPAAARSGAPARRLWQVVSWAATLMVVGVMVAVIGLVTVPRMLGWQGLIVLSGSMEPTLKTGSLAFVMPASAHEIEAGDVITYRREGSRKTLVTHRVVEVLRADQSVEFVTQGDANTAPDASPISEEQFVGLVRYYLPFIGNVIDALHDRTNYYIFLGIPAGLLILNEVASIRTEIRKARKREEPEPSCSIEGAYS